ncbi:hypothetical protein O4G98_19980 [Zoogloeaceae bacterium G21618-S1]|nr:hypothetical protein [Zoogloeaceae bacterium G21618-S1]
MIIDFFLDNPFWIFVALVIATFVWKMVRHGGFRAAMFGSSIERTVGEVNGEPSSLHSFTVKIHKLSGASEGKAVGLELVSKSIASYQILPVTLSAQTARELSELLRTAAGSSHK